MLIIIITSIVIAIILIVLVLILFFARGGSTILDQEKYRTEWLKIENGLDKKNVATFQFALLAADKLLEQALIDIKVDGETIEERIKITKNRFLNGMQLATARKITKKLTGKDDSKVNITLVKRALNAYKKALKELKAI